MFTACAPRAGRSVVKKESFWEQFEKLLHTIPTTENIVVCEGLNGHVCKSHETYSW